MAKPLSAREKMASGVWYSCLDDELEALRTLARLAVHDHNSMSPDQRGNIAPCLKQLFRSCADDVFLEAPFHCAYGINISLGKGVYLNAGCVILDTAQVSIGAGSLLGPTVQIYCAEHHKEADKRAKGLEIAKPVTIGEQVWIGGGAIILPGVTIGMGATIGAGSVVTKDVAAGVTYVGNPARAVDPITT